MHKRQPPRGSALSSSPCDLRVDEAWASRCSEFTNSYWTVYKGRKQTKRRPSISVIHVFPADFMTPACLFRFGLLSFSSFIWTLFVYTRLLSRSLSLAL